MKTSKLVVGIISIVLCFLVGLQSCAAGLGNALENNGEIGGTAGLILALSLLCAGSYSDLNIWSVVSLIFGGICTIATRKQK